MTYVPKGCHNPGCENPKPRGRGYRYCADCAPAMLVRSKKAANDAWNESHPDTRAQRLWTRYRMTEEDFDARLAAQGGVCAICTGLAPGGAGGWHVDHDHSCCPGRTSCGLCLRGLLCTRCNFHILSVVEGPLLAPALRYLEVRKQLGVVKPSPVLAAYAWPTNAHMILDVVRLGYLKDTDYLADVTFGGGKWWTRWRQPDVCHDIALDGVDFRRLPEADDTFDSVAFDPPYVAVGGRTTTGMPEFFERYGLTDAPKRPAELQEMNNAGLAECLRVVKPNGIVIVKSTDYVSSGKLFIGTHHTLTAALDLGFTLQDRMEHLGKVRPQPPRTRKDGKPVRQHHARRNLSTLLVLRA